MTRSLRVGTRGSALALRQTSLVLGRLRPAHPDLTVDSLVLRAQGDEENRSHVDEAPGTKGAFTSTLEEALLDGSIDLAVHSLKDLPLEATRGLVIAAVPEREDPRDVLVSGSGTPANAIRKGARIGTSSLRRIAQLRALWPHLRVEEMHGNVDTRLRRLDAGEFDGIVLAAAGLRRLGMEDRITEAFSPEDVLPAPGQGALAVQARSEDAEVIAVLTAIDDPEVRLSTDAERALSASLGGMCEVPVGALAHREGTTLTLRGAVASVDGGRVIRASASGTAERWEAVVQAVASGLLSGGAKEILPEVA